MSVLGYTLRFPFVLAPRQSISGLDQPTSWEDGQLVFTLERNEPYYVIRVQGFPSEEAAKGYLSQLWAGLSWVALNRGVASYAEMEFDTVIYSDDPYKAADSLHRSFGLPNTGPVHALASGNRPSVYPSDMRVRFITLGNATISSALSANSFLELLVEGVTRCDGEQMVENPKLRTALDLYGAYYTEVSSNARLLTLVIALEALSEQQERHPAALEVLEEWIAQLDERKSRLSSDPEAFSALDSLKGGLQNLRTTSIGNSIRRLVTDSLSYLGEPVAQQYAKRSTKVYSWRSTLVHEGDLSADDMREALLNAKEIVEQVLQAAISDRSNLATTSTPVQSDTSPDL